MNYFAILQGLRQSLLLSYIWLSIPDRPEISSFLFFFVCHLFFLLINVWISSLFLTIAYFGRVCGKNILSGFLSFYLHLVLTLDYL